LNILINTINRIEQLIREIPDRVTGIDKAEFDFKPGPGKWSKKEILGHLCDSAANNLSRFIRAQFEEQPFAVVSYEQDEWVRANNYRKMETEDILTYWVTLNRQIVHIVKNISDDKLAVECSLGNAAFRDDGKTKTLLWLIEDYLVHMEYHLKQITGES
jgi:DinB superfamily